MVLRSVFGIALFLAGVFPFASLADEPPLPQEDEELQGPGRRLWGFDASSLPGLIGGGAGWAESALQNVGKIQGLMSLSDAASKFNEAGPWVDKGLAAANSAQAAMMQLGGQMSDIFSTFTPLQPIFADQNGGLLKLITSQDNMRTLMATVQKLTSTSSVLGSLSTALDQVSVMFAQVQEVLTNVLAKLSGRNRRRLQASYQGLLTNIDFKKQVQQFAGFVGILADTSKNLTSIDAALGPLMAKLSSFLTSKRRRLTERQLQDITADQKKYSDAILKIVPTWKTMESTGNDLCPNVAYAKSSIGNLKCRVANFASQAVVPSWVPSQVTSLVTSCGLDPAKSIAANATAGCSSALTSGVQDLLGNNAGRIGWVLAIFSALGCLGVGGVGAGVVAKSLAGGKEEQQLLQEETQDERA